jgi:hypothetical protein
MTHQTKIIGPRLTALLTRKHLEIQKRDGGPVYSFTWIGYQAGEKAAIAKGFPAVQIMQNDLQPTPVAAPVVRKAPTTGKTDRGDDIQQL